MRSWVNVACGACGERKSSWLGLIIILSLCSVFVNFCDLAESPPNFAVFPRARDAGRTGKGIADNEGGGFGRDAGGGPERCLPELLAQDDREFHPWEERGAISPDDVEGAWKYVLGLPWRNYMRIVVLEDRIYATSWRGGGVGPVSADDNRSVLLMVLKILIFANSHNNTVPHLDFVVNVGDLCDGYRTLEKTHPIWSWSVDTNKCSDFFMPYWSFLWPDKANPKRSVWSKLFGTNNASPKRLAWSDRSPKIVWRGTTTGCTTNLTIKPRLAWETGTGNWTMCPRAVLVKNCMEIPDHCDAGFHQIEGGKEVPTELDGYMKPKIKTTGEFKYKFQVLVDGNGPPSSRSLRLLGTGSATLKQLSPMAEFYYPLLQPYVNYIPVSHSVDDINHVLHWALGHDDEARMIAENALSVHEYLSDHRVTCWMVNKLHRYSKLMGRPTFNTSGLPPFTLDAASVDQLCRYMEKTSLSSKEKCNNFLAKYGMTEVVE